ncbi:MAG: glycosyltransferase [Acidobacteria bacterium]|nr:glycosyltransferase [Acidobacteriota bacterium]
MKALYIAFDVFPKPKGSTSHIASMVGTLGETFGEVELLCLGTPEMPAWQREGRIEIRRFNERRRELTGRATAFARFVQERVRALRGDLALAVFRDPWGGVPLLKTGPGCAAIFEVNALPTWELSYSRPALQRNAALRAKLGDMERLCLRKAARILCVSSVTREALCELGVERGTIRVIPNAAHDVFFDEGAECPIAALQAGEWFGYIGSLQPWQGVETVIDALALLAEDAPESRLLVLHGGNPRAARALERRAAKRGLSDRVLLHAPLGREGVAGVLRRLRFTTAPLADTARNTVQGCCPVKMIESMAAGTPVIASDLAACREWMQEEKEGLLAPAGDARGWALRMRRLLRDERLRERLGHGARERARACFARAVVERELSEQFLEIAGGGVP